VGIWDALCSKRKGEMEKGGWKREELEREKERARWSGGDDGGSGVSKEEGGKKETERK